MPGLDTRGLFWSARADSHRSWLFKSIPYEWGAPLALKNRHRIGNKDTHTWPTCRCHPILIQITESNGNQAHVGTHGTGNRERFAPRDVTKAIEQGREGQNENQQGKDGRDQVPSDKNPAQNTLRPKDDRYLGIK